MEVSEKGSMADGAGDGERSSESKFESDDEPVELTGEFGILKMHMDVHFERQARFFEELLTTKSNTILRQRTKESMLKMAGTEMALPEPRVSQGNAALQLPVPQLTTANSFRSTISSSPPGRRDSVRKSFVRAGMEDKQGRARAAASRITFAREGRAHSAADRVDWRGRIQALVISPFFTNFIMFLIVTNAVLLGVEIDVSAKVGQDDIPTWFGTLNSCLVFVFVSETALKLIGLGCQEFWRGEESVWNVFDFTIVTLSVVETMVDWWAQSISSSADGSNSFRVMRALRLVRTLRGFRIIRLFRYFSALRGLILSIFSTMGSLLWTLLLLLILFYTFGCIFTQLVTDHCRFMAIEQNADNNAIPACEDNLQPYWVNVMDSMMTLFMSITGGINWFEAYEPLRQVSLMALWLFNLYVVIGFFTILNVVTGVFVNTAIESASADKDIATLKQMQKRLENMSSLREVFQEMNAFNVNEVSLDDLEDALSQNKLGTFMESLGISTDDVWSLFLLIDSDSNGVLDLEEFVTGCMQLRGPAKSLQVAKMSYENKVTRQAIKHLHEDVMQLTRMVKSGLKYRMVKEVL